MLQASLTKKSPLNESSVSTYFRMKGHKISTGFSACTTQHKYELSLRYLLPFTYKSNFRENFCKKTTVVGEQVLIFISGESFVIALAMPCLQSAQQTLAMLTTKYPHLGINTFPNLVPMYVFSAMSSLILQAVYLKSGMQTP